MSIQNPIRLFSRPSHSALHSPQDPLIPGPYAIHLLPTPPTRSPIATLPYLPYLPPLIFSSSSLRSDIPRPVLAVHGDPTEAGEHRLPDPKVRISDRSSGVVWDQRGLRAKYKTRSHRGNQDMRTNRWVEDEVEGRGLTRTR